MIIDGKAIAHELFEDLKKRVGEIKEKNLPAGRNGIEPHLAVILVGNDPASVSYVRQKEIKTKEVGAKYTGYHLSETISQKELSSLIEKLNNDPKIHGIIVQLPLPKHLDENIALEVNPKKDIDAFNPLSPYPMPLAKAVLKILENVASQGLTLRGKNFIEWIRTQNIVVIGKGKTGGGPTIKMFKKLDLKPQIIDSKTESPKEITKDADIIVSSVGKSNMITPDMIKRGVILISVGMYKGTDGKLHGDYNEEKIKDIASFYTPIPGGVGPVNVACLIENLILSAEK